MYCTVDDENLLPSHITINFTLHVHVPLASSFTGKPKMKNL